LRRTRVAGFGPDGAVSLAALKAGEFSTLDLSDVARATFPVRDISLDEKLELSFGRTLSPNPTEGIHAGISTANELIALLNNVAGKAKPIAVFAAAH
jgi:tRNA pseudouridine55 synthase